MINLFRVFPGRISEDTYFNTVVTDVIGRRFFFLLIDIVSNQ